MLRNQWKDSWSNFSLSTCLRRATCPPGKLDPDSNPVRLNSKRVSNLQTRAQKIIMRFICKNFWSSHLTLASDLKSIENHCMWGFTQRLTFGSMRKTACTARSSKSSKLSLPTDIDDENAMNRSVPRTDGDPVRFPIMVHGCVRKITLRHPRKPCEDFVTSSKSFCTSNCGSLSVKQRTRISKSLSKTSLYQWGAKLKNFKGHKTEKIDGYVIEILGLWKTDFYRKWSFRFDSPFKRLP